MPDGIINVDGEILKKLSETISRCIAELHTAHKNAEVKINSVSGDWSDENYTELIDSLKIIQQRIDSFEEITLQSQKKIQNALDMLQAIHSVQM